MMFQIQRVVVATVIGSILLTDAQAAEPKYNAKDFESLIEELSNWGRWGADDQRGALNLTLPRSDGWRPNW